MLPKDPRDAQACLMRWTGGHGAAAEFLSEIAAIARLADDVVDKAEHRQRHLCWLMSRALTVLPLNPFFVAHAAQLAPMLNTILVQWELSDSFRQSGDRLKETYGFVMREAVGGLVTAVAHILGGYEHGRLVAEDFFATCHAGSPETVEDWVREL